MNCWGGAAIKRKRAPKTDDKCFFFFSGSCSSSSFTLTHWLTRVWFNPSLSLHLISLFDFFLYLHSLSASFSSEWLPETPTLDSHGKYWTVFLFYPFCLLRGRNRRSTAHLDRLHEFPHAALFFSWIIGTKHLKLGRNPLSLEGGRGSVGVSN